MTKPTYELHFINEDAKNIHDEISKLIDHVKKYKEAYPSTPVLTVLLKLNQVLASFEEETAAKVATSENEL